jgi:hypothetical protein
VILFNLVTRSGETLLNHRFFHSAFGATAIAKPQRQHFRIGGKNKDGDGLRHVLPNLRGTLDIDVEQQVVATRSGLGQTAASRAVIVSKHVGVLQELIPINHPLKSIALDEVVFAAFLL